MPQGVPPAPRISGTALSMPSKNLLKHGQAANKPLIAPVLRSLHSLSAFCCSRCRFAVPVTLLVAVDVPGRSSDRAYLLATLDHQFVQLEELADNRLALRMKLAFASYVTPTVFCGCAVSN
jgi:hypothetical protein